MGVLVRTAAYVVVVAVAQTWVSNLSHRLTAAV